MVLGNVERFEVVIIVFDIRAAGDLETHARKNIDNLVDHEGQRMRSAALPTTAGKRDIDLVFLDPLRFGLLFDHAKAFIQARLDFTAQVIELFSGARAFLRGQVLQSAQEESESPLAAQDFDPELLDLRCGARLLDSIQNLSLESFQGIVHRTVEISA